MLAGLRLRLARLFLDELEAPFALIASAPTSDSPIEDRCSGHATDRLGANRYHVYYVPLDDELVVLAVWHASRGSGPPLLTQTAVAVRSRHPTPLNRQIGVAVNVSTLSRGASRSHKGLGCRKERQGSDGGKHVREPATSPA
jgi:plasmid stabilization system protein ParE